MSNDAPQLDTDILKSKYIVDKIKTNSAYAQAMYAALCNMRWQKIELWPILTDQFWSCSWRAAGGIISDIREEGDYLTWYCSGIVSYELKENTIPTIKEGVVTDEIAADLRALGWGPRPWPED